MRPGPPQIIACPHCQALARYLTLLSGNTIGARLWTDGKRLAPMFPRPPAVVRCHRCRQCYWLAAAPEIGLLERRGEDGDPAWQSARPVREPNEAEYYRAIRGGLAAGAAQEQRLRTLAWWRHNDAFRALPGPRPARVAAAPAYWRKNLEALAALLDEAIEDERLMKAEALRELGQFAASRLLLDRVTAEKYAFAVSQIGALCAAGDVQVRELQLVDR